MSLLSYVSYIIFCLKCLMSYVVSCLTCLTHYVLLGLAFAVLSYLTPSCPTCSSDSCISYVLHVSYVFTIGSRDLLALCALHTLVPPNTSRAVHDHVSDKLLCLTCFLYLVPYILHLSTSTFLFLYSHGSNDFSEFISNS